MNIAKRIEQLCIERGLSENKLAGLADLSQSTLNSIMLSPNPDPKLSTIAKICDGLEITLAEFFSEEKQENTLPFEARQELKKFTEYLYFKYKNSD